MMFRYIFKSTVFCANRSTSTSKTSHDDFQKYIALFSKRKFSETSNIKSNTVSTTHALTNPAWNTWNSWNNKDYFYPIPKKVKIVEVGARDGIQNENNNWIIPIDIKYNLLKKLSNTGIINMEGGSFSHPKWIPQMATSPELFNLINNKLIPNNISHNKNITYSALVPNIKGLERAMKYNINEIMVITAASETLCKANMNCNIKDSLLRCKDVIIMAHENNIRVRGGISCCLGCPYEGIIEPEAVCDIISQLDELNICEYVIGDTNGIGTPGITKKLFKNIKQRMEIEENKNEFMQTKIVAHFHNTYGQALSNILTSLQFGISTIDSSVSGLGGCPYSPGATGNVATEDVVYMLHSLGIETGINLDKLIDTSIWLTNALGKTRNASSVSNAVMNKKKLDVDQ